MICKYNVTALITSTSDAPKKNKKWKFVSRLCSAVNKLHTVDLLFSFSLGLISDSQQKKTSTESNEKSQQNDECVPQVSLFITLDVDEFFIR